MENISPFAVKTLKAHVSLNVRNVAQSIEFYKKMLGIEPCKVRQGYAKFDVQNPPLNLALNEIPVQTRGALSHLGIQVASTDDVLAVRKQWEKAGLNLRDEMQTNCCYAIQDKTWVADPDGNEWEVFVVLQDNLAESSVCCVTEEASPAKVDAPTSCATTTASEANSCCTVPPALVGLARKSGEK